MAVTIVSNTSSANDTTLVKNNAFAGNAFSLTNLNGGTNFSSGRVVVGFCTVQAVIDSSVPLTVGSASNALTLAVADGANHTSIWYGDIGTGVTDIVTISSKVASAYDYVAVTAWLLQNVSSGTPTSTSATFGANTSSEKLTISNNAGGMALAVGTVINASAYLATFTWTNATADMTIASSSAANISVAGAHNGTTGSQTIQFSYTNGNTFSGGLVAASFDTNSVTTVIPPSWELATGMRVEFNGAY